MLGLIASRLGLSKPDTKPKSLPKPVELLGEFDWNPEVSFGNYESQNAAVTIRCSVPNGDSSIFEVAFQGKLETLFTCEGDDRGAQIRVSVPLEWLKAMNELTGRMLQQYAADGLAPKTRMDDLEFPF